MQELTKAEFRQIKKVCKKQAEAVITEMYQRYDDIWWRRIRITQSLYDHGEDTVREINRLMPNLLTHQPHISPSDEVAADFGFESEDALIEFLLAYTPRGPMREEVYEGLLAQSLAAYNVQPAPEHSVNANSGGLADIPF
ncbi:iron receptor [Oleidesulfovibrio sp.]|uniref:iron receptor n=1 Tax=Oleidesulfovibrio sp. TaxID=2909707 RepID=UPI003A8B9D57